MATLHSKDVFRLQIPMPIMHVMYFLQCVGQPTKLADDIFHQVSGEAGLIISPELPQVPSIGPFAHEIALGASGNGTYELDDVAVINFGDLLVCFNFFLPLLLKFVLRLCIASRVGTIQLLDGNAAVDLY